MLVADLLGPLRVRLRRTFHRAPAPLEHWDGHVGVDRNFCRDDCARDGSQTVSEMEAADGGGVSRSGAHLNYSSADFSLWNFHTNVYATTAKIHRLIKLRKKYFILSFRAKRGISL